MTKHLHLTTAAIAALLLSALAASTAQAYGDRVQSACKGDYLSYCSEHPVGSTGLRRCMEANGKGLSRSCINALVDAGEIPKKYKR